MKVSHIRLILGIGILTSISACRQHPVAELSENERLIERALSFELDTPYELPPGDPLSHHSAGLAKVLCSAVFITGLDFDFAAEHVG